MTDPGRLAVFIATTTGPVEIQRIAAEDPEIDSVICLAGKAQPLPISEAYRNFVRQPTGLVQRDFGHGAFRVDLSATIEDGYSWQLGLYLGHAAHHEDRLTTHGGDPAQAVFATGEVNVDRSVDAVGHVGIKLARLKASAAEIAANGVGVKILIPAGNEADIPDDWPHDRLPIRAVSGAKEALAIFGLTSPESTSAATLAERPPAGRQQRRRTAAALVLLAAAMGFGAYAYLAPQLEHTQAPRPDSAPPGAGAAEERAAPGNAIDKLPAKVLKKLGELQRPAFGGVRIRLIEHRPPPGKTCAAVRFGAAAAVPREAERSTAREFPPSRFERLCTMEFIAESTDDETYLWGRYVRWPTGEPVISETLIDGPKRGALRWRIELPRHLRTDFGMHVLVVAGPQPVDPAAPDLSSLLPPPGPPVRGPQWAKSVRALEARGIVLTDAAVQLTR